MDAEQTTTKPENEISHDQNVHQIDILGNLEEEKKFAQKLRDQNSISPTLIENPRANLSFRTEFELYYDRVFNRRDAEDRALIEQFSQKIDITNKTRTMTVMPVYVREDKLTRALDSYTRISAEDLSQHQIVLFLNAGSDMSSEEYQANSESRRKEIAVFVEKHPNILISVIDHHFSEKVVLGRVRGLMADAAMLKAYRVGADDPIFISNDSDQVGMATRHFEFIKNAYDSNLGLDAAGCTTLWSGYNLNGETIGNEAKLPEVWFGDLFSHASDGVVRNGEAGILSNFYTCGPNSNFRGAALCAMGGYDYTLNFKEEVEIGRRAKAMRMTDDDLGFYHPKHYQFIKDSWVSTSPRRAIRSILAGGVLLTQWDDFDSIVGAGMDEKLLSIKYQENSELIQLVDLLEARNGNEVALKKIEDRLSKVLMLLLQADSVIDQDQFEAILRRLGIQCAVGSNPTQLAVDLENSSLFKLLTYWASDTIKS